MSEARRGLALHVLISRMRHDRCGGLTAKAELLTGIEGVSAGRAAHRAAGGPRGLGAPRLQHHAETGEAQR
jgi:hypothetical protein